VDQYAERLRALHRDLTLVLQAVERGLAAAAHPEDVAPPVPAQEPIEIVPEPAEAPGPPVAPPATARVRTPRVEVMPAPSGESRRHDQEDRREPPAAADPAPRWSKENGTSQIEEGDDDERRPRAAARFPARPSVISVPPPEPEWVDRGEEGFTAPTFPPAGSQLRVSPLLVTAIVIAWLVVVGLLVALLLS